MSVSVSAEKGIWAVNFWFVAVVSGKLFAMGTCFEVGAQKISCFSLPN